MRQRRPPDECGVRGVRGAPGVRGARGVRGVRAAGLFEVAPLPRPGGPATGTVAAALGAALPQQAASSAALMMTAKAAVDTEKSDASEWHAAPAGRQPACAVAKQCGMQRERTPPGRAPALRSNASAPLGRVGREYCRTRAPARGTGPCCSPAPAWGPTAQPREFRCACAPAAPRPTLGRRPCRWSGTCPSTALGPLPPQPYVMCERRADACAPSGSAAAPCRFALALELGTATATPHVYVSPAATHLKAPAGSRPSPATTAQPHERETSAQAAVARVRAVRVPSPATHVARVHRDATCMLQADGDLHEPHAGYEPSSARAACGARCARAGTHMAGMPARTSCCPSTLPHRPSAAHT